MKTIEQIKDYLDSLKNELALEKELQSDLQDKSTKLAIKNKLKEIRFAQEALLIIEKGIYTDLLIDIEIEKLDSKRWARLKQKQFIEEFYKGKKMLQSDIESIKLLNQETRLIDEQIFMLEFLKDDK